MSVQKDDDVIIMDNGEQPDTTEIDLPNIICISDDESQEILEPPVPEGLEEESGKSVFKVTFSDTDSAKKYIQKLREIIEREMPNCEVTLSHMISDVPTQLKVCEKTENGEVDGFDMIIDKEGKDHDGSSVPSYIMEFSNSLQDVSVEEEENPKDENNQPEMSCFNCSGNHTLPQCPEPLDQKMIFSNRRKYFAGRRQLKSNRYHELSQQSGLIPGKLSRNLCKALGLRHNQIPRYIYKMRVLGYPPAWLEEAKIEKSGIKLYDSHKKNIENIVDDNMMGYDFSKLYDYPGFNVELPPGCRDEAKFFNMPPMSDQNLKKNWHRYIKKASGNPFALGVRPRSDKCKDSNGDSSKNDESDVEIISSTYPEDIKKTRKSPTLEYLEEQKSNLMKLLSQGDVGASSFIDVDQPPHNSPSRKDDANGEQGSMQNTAAALHTSTPIRCNVRDSSCDFGTPIVKGHSPYTSLPEFSKFAVNITDHIPYENLPDAIGSYDKIRVVLNKINKSKG